MSAPVTYDGMWRRRRQKGPGLDSMSRIEIHLDWCKGCHICVGVCPRHVLEVDEAAFLNGFHPVAVARPDDCTSCLLCELLCPDLAITVEPKTRRKGS
jgi:2-oxoglutarate ferredoxin oxidoreductase subunit delta